MESNRNPGDAGGITNRPLGQEQEEQSHLPERGRSRQEQSTDVGRTSGGGNLGHAQPDQPEQTHDANERPRAEP